MSTDESPREARLAATALLPAVDPVAAPAGDDFGATTLDRPAFDLEDLAAIADAPPDAAPPPAPPSRRPVAPPESDAILWIVLALAIACALGVATGLAVGLAELLADEAPALETDDGRGG